MGETNFLDISDSPEEDRRHVILKTIEQYPLAWKVIHEAVQNSIDSIERKGIEGEIDIVMDLTNQSIQIKDNGFGFPHDVGFLGFGKSDKNDGQENEKGCMGVGLKVIMISSKEFFLQSVRDNKSWWAKQNNGYKFSEEEDGKIEFSDEATDTEEESGTILKYSFPDKEVSEFLKEVWLDYKSVSDKSANDCLSKLKVILEWHFRTKSYAAFLNPVFEEASVPKINILIKYNPSTLDYFSEDIKEALQSVTDSKLKLDFPASYWYVKQVIDRYPRRTRKPEIYNQNLISEGGNLNVPLNENYIYEAVLTNEAAYKSLLVNPNARDQVEPDKYQSLLPKIKGIYILIGAQHKLRELMFSSSEQRIFAKGVPTIHDIRAPGKGGEIGRLSQIHFLVSVDQELNYGKQMISNTWLLGQVNKFFEDAYSKTLRNIARKVIGSSGESGSGAREGDLVDKDIVDRDDLGISTLSIKKVPVDENAVIALFFELIGRGILTGFHIYSLHGKDTYDCRARMKRSNDSTIAIPSTDNQLEIIEFKQKLSGVIPDFEDEKKDPNKINLIVVWEIDFDEKTGYHVVNISETPDNDRIYPEVGVSLHCIKDGRFIQILELKKIVESRSS